MVNGMVHNIIDNREEILLDHVKGLLKDSSSASFAVGFLYLSGLRQLIDEIERDDFKLLRLLIGNVSSRYNVEQIAELHGTLDRAKVLVNKEIFLNASGIKEAAQETMRSVSERLGQMVQSDESVDFLERLREHLETMRIVVNVYTHGRLHAKAYIFDYPTGRYDRGNAIIGSSNLTLHGLTHNTELNAVIPGNENYERISQWFEDLWKDSEPFSESLMQALDNSWALHQGLRPEDTILRPYDIYIRTLYVLLQDRLEGEEAAELLWERDMPPVTDFQKVAVRQALQILRDNGGVFIADVVGLGKTYISIALLKHLQQIEGARPLIICPATLVNMWEEMTAIWDLAAPVLSMGLLSQGDVDLVNDSRYKDRDIILIDESHNFRYPDTNRYKSLENYVLDKRTILVTATPRNNTAWDIYHQARLFLQDEEAYMVEPTNLKEFFKLVEEGEREVQEFLRKVLIRRTRKHILDHYGHKDEEGRRYILVADKPFYFPIRELQDPVTYSIDKTYTGLYDEIYELLRGESEKGGGKGLRYGKYGLWHYVKAEKQHEKPYSDLQQIGKNLKGLMKVLLLKRFESSVNAFRETVRRLKEIHERFLIALDGGIVPAGDEASDLLYDAEGMDEEMLLEQLDKLKDRYDPESFHLDELRRDIEADANIFEHMYDLVKDIAPENDDKLKALKRLLQKPEVRGNKVLLFTEYADTAKYLYQNVKEEDVAIVTSKSKNLLSLVRRFAPNSNNYTPKPGEELRFLVSTDVLAAGLNLQDAFILINYDIHWNPVRLIQRTGRLDRIGSKADKILVFNFLPETALDEKLGLLEKVRQRIKDIQETIGEDAQILDKSERLNEEALYAIYVKREDRLDEWEKEFDPLSQKLYGLTEAEALLNELRKERPEYFEKIADMQDGVRSAKAAEKRTNFVYCKMGNLDRLYLTDGDGKVVSKSESEALETIRSEEEELPLPLPKAYNDAVWGVFKQFRRLAEETRAKKATAASTLKPQVRYALTQLQSYYEKTEDPEAKEKVETFRRALKGPLPGMVLKHLGQIRRASLTGEELFERIRQIYWQYGLYRFREEEGEEEEQVERLVCSMALMEKQ